MNIIALLLRDMGIRPVHGLDVFPEGTRVCVPLRAARDFTDVGFLSIQANLGLYLEQAQIFQVVYGPRKYNKHSGWQQQNEEHLLHRIL